MLTAEAAVNTFLDAWKRGENKNIRDFPIGRVVMPIRKPEDDYERHMRQDLWLDTHVVTLHETLNVVCHGDARTRLPLTPPERDRLNDLIEENKRLRNRLNQIAGFAVLPEETP